MKPYGAITRCPLILLVVITGLLSGCAANPVTGDSDFVMMSEADEIAMGRNAHPEVLKQYAVYDNQPLQDYIQEVGEKLAANSHRSNLIYRFTLLDSVEVNAFALPGGYIYITRGLLAYLNSEAELAAVLGHEIGHVTARHSVRQISAARAASIGYAIGSIFSPGLGTQLGQNVFNILGNAWLSGYGREHELEADRLGAEYLARSGYDPQAMIGVIGVLKDQEEFERQLAKEEGRDPHIYHGVFASHPDNDARLQEVVASAEAFRTEESTTVNREPFLHMIDGLVFGNSERDGILRGNTFYHHDLGIALTLPSEWHVDNLPDRIVARINSGDALLQISTEDLNKRISPREFMEERLKLKEIGAGEEIHPDGLDGYTGIAQLRRTPFGSRKGRVSVVFFNDRAFIFVGATKDKGSPEPEDEAFLAAVNSFHALTAEEQILARAIRLKIVSAESGMSFAELATQSRLHSHAEEQLRLLNHYYPGGEPEPGQLIKIVE